jgi:hypothetical protein
MLSIKFRFIWQSSEEKILRNRPISTKNCLLRPCLLMDRDKISNMHWGSSIDASYQVLAHLAKQCQRRRFFSQPNELKLGRKHLLKVLYIYYTVCYDPITNMTATGNSWFWLADIKKSSPLTLLGQMSQNLVGSIVHLAGGFQRRRLKCEKLTRDGRQVMAKAHIPVLDITSFFFRIHTQRKALVLRFFYWFGLT